MVDLPLPDRKRRRRRRSTQETGADDALRGEVGALRAQIERLRAELAGREREINSLHEQLDTERGHDPAADRAAPDEHTVEITQLESELARIRREHEAGAQGMTVEIERLARERDDAHAAASEAVAAERERWQSDLADLREAFAEAAAEAEATREAHAAEVASLESQLRNERAEIARLLTTVAEREQVATAPTAPMPPPEDGHEAGPAAVAEPTAPMPAPAPPADVAPEPPDTEETDALRVAEESTRSFSRVPAWLRTRGTGDEDETEPRPASKLTAWLRGGRPLEAAVADAEAEPPASGATVADETDRASRIPAWLRGGEMGEGPGASRGAADAEWSGDAVAEPPAAPGEDERAAVRAPAWLRVDPDTLNGLRDKLLGRRETDAPDDDPDRGVPALPPPIRTRTDARLRGSASLAAHRNATEVWTLRVVAAIMVVVLLTAFVLLLAYLA